MLSTQLPKSGLLFASFLYRTDLHTKPELTRVWETLFGKSFSLDPKVNPLKNYYSEEMGEPQSLGRFFLVSGNPFPREYFLSAKLQALEWERGWAKDGKRGVNLDTGFLSLENFILATTKNYSHRIFVGQNIFADLTYHYHLGKLESFPWTYPDYLDEEKLEFFTWARSYLLQKLTLDNS